MLQVKLSLCVLGSQDWLPDKCRHSSLRILWLKYWWRLHFTLLRMLEANSLFKMTPVSISPSLSIWNLFWVLSSIELNTKVIRHGAVCGLKTWRTHGWCHFDATFPFSLVFPHPHAALGPCVEGSVLPTLYTSETKAPGHSPLEDTTWLSLSWWLTFFCTSFKKALLRSGLSSQCQRVEPVLYVNSAPWHVISWKCSLNGSRLQSEYL